MLSLLDSSLHRAHPETQCWALQGRTRSQVSDLVMLRSCVILYIYTMFERNIDQWCQMRVRSPGTRSFVLSRYKIKTELLLKIQVHNLVRPLGLYRLRVVDGP